MFITFEGPDGSGKTTAIKTLAKYFDKENVNYILTREPGTPHTNESKLIREIIVNPDYNIPPITEALLFAADRRMHLDNIILPALKNGKIVLCDRYIDSSLAYQGAGRDIGIENVKVINEIATNGKYPDLTIFFNITLENSIKRVDKKAQKDRIELAGLNFHKKVYVGYQQIAKMFPERYQIIDANKSIDDVFKQIKKIIDNKVLKK